MKRHANKKIKFFSILLGFVAMGGLIGIHDTDAIDKTEDVNVKFTFNSTLKLDIDQNSITISDLMPGTAKESNGVKLTISTNNSGGYYLSATAGKKSTNTNLNRNGGGGAFQNMETTANFSSISAAKDNTWGFAFVTGANGDLSKGTYFGLPQDGEDNGQTGKRLITATDQNGEKVVKFKIGAKANMAMPAGTYSNEIHFYAVTNN